MGEKAIISFVSDKKCFVFHFKNGNEVVGFVKESKVIGGVPYLYIKDVEEIQTGYASLDSIVSIKEKEKSNEL
ncbi:hypothetical protein M2150_001705 [Lachnospiraceae bacterium PM6-15]|uniref:hypothetical protein n=1 Tax=Ohessyouella blattaphilus TaxID=2949333 RepID=UPI003E266ADD